MAHAAPTAHAPRATEVDNIRRWDGHAKGCYEVWYLTFNHRASGTGYWLRYTLESPLGDNHAPYCQLWFARFDAADPARNVAINRKFPIGQMRASTSPFLISIDECTLAHDGAMGNLSGDGHQIHWDVSWQPALRTHRQLPPVMYRRGGLGETTVLTPNLNVTLRGRLTIDGEVLELNGEPGGQTHIWGKKHAHAWAWGHCNAFRGLPDAALETLTVRLKKRGRVLPNITVLGLYANGRGYRFNSYRDALWSRAEYRTGYYRFSARGLMSRIDGTYRCRPADMVVATYHDPDGELSYCANTEVADLEIRLQERDWRGRWHTTAELDAPHSGHFEIGGRERDPAITRDHVTVEDA